MEFQSPEKPEAALDRRHDVNPKTVARWRKRDGVEDLPIGPREPKSTTLKLLEEAAIVSSRVQTRLPLVDVLPNSDTVHTVAHPLHAVPPPPAPEPGKAPLFVALNRTAKFTFAASTAGHHPQLGHVPQGDALPHPRLLDQQRHPVRRRRQAAPLRVPPPLRTAPPSPRHQAYADPPLPPVDQRAGPERMIHAFKEATVRTCHYETYRQLRRHVADYLAAYSYLAKPLMALKWKMPHETIQALWESKSQLSYDPPDHPETVCPDDGHHPRQNR